MTEKSPAVGILPIQLKRHPQQFGYPAYSFMAPIQWNGKVVGQVSYGFNPLDDTLYIFRLDIKPQFQRQHLGLATLWRLHLEYQLPIVPVGQPHPFWQSARIEFAAGAALIHAELPADKLDDEAKRWQHLVHAFNENARNVKLTHISPRSGDQ